MFSTLIFYSSSAIINFIVSLCFAVFVLYKDAKHPTSRYFAYFILTLSFWSFFYAGWLLSNDAILGDYLVRTCMAGVIIMPSAFTLFVASLTKTKLPRWVYAGNYLLTILFISAIYTPLFAKSGGRFFIFPYWPKPGLFFHFHLIHFAVNVSFAHMLLIVKYFTIKEGQIRRQILYVLLAGIFGFLGGSINFLPWYRIPIFPVTTILVLLWVLLPSYAILKHHLLDIRVALTRTGILILVYVSTIAIPLMFAGGFRDNMIALFGKERWFYPPWFLYSVLALLAPYVYIRLQEKSEHKRMLQQLRLHQSLKDASKTTIEVQSIDKLSKIIPRYLLRLYSVSMNNKISHISLFLKEKRKNVYALKSSVGDEKISAEMTIPMDSYLVKWFTIIRGVLVEKGRIRAKDLEVLVYDDVNYWITNPSLLRSPFRGLDKVLKQLKESMESLHAHVILPSIYQKELLGFLILGEKNPEPYSSSDIDTFSILANDSAMAFKAAQLFEDLKATQAHLIQSEKLNLLGQLASSMAHEINNPLAIISGNIQLLLLDEPNEERKKILKKVDAQTERGYTIIHRLLNFSRLPKEEIKVIDVNNMIDETLELINHKILHGNVQLERNYTAVTPINGNPVQIQEVLLNLFVNAVQSMPEGGRLKLSTQQADGRIIIEVQDTGKGIAEEDIKNIFDPFFTKGKENGTGLGLFVAAQIMALHNGTIEVNSKVGQGTCFVLKFPLK